MSNNDNSNFKFNSSKVSVPGEKRGLTPASSGSPMPKVKPPAEPENDIKSK